MATQKNERTSNNNSVSLYNDLKKLAKRANQRILRLERLTGQTGSFGVKQLYDYLDSDTLNALTSKGRVAVRRDFDETQMKAIIKATKNFLSDETISTKRQINKYIKQLEKDTLKSINISQANVYYQSTKTYTWIYQYFDSDFWDIARESVAENYSFKQFKEELVSMANSNRVDELLKEDLQGLYNYIME